MKNFKNQKGVTLLEVVISALLLAFVMSGLLSVFANATKMIRPQEDIGHHLSQGLIEPLYTFVRSTGYNTNTLSQPAAGTMEVDGAVYPWERTPSDTVTDRDGDGNPDYRIVRFKVSLP